MITGDDLAGLMLLAFLLFTKIGRWIFLVLIVFSFGYMVAIT